MGATERIVAELAARIGPAVVGLGHGARGGSAVIVAGGQAITLARNLRADEVTVHFGTGEEGSAKLAGVDEASDVAVLALEAADVAPVAWSETPAAVGRSVFALADPAGRGLRVTAGHVSSAPRRIRGPRGRILDGVIEHTAPLPRGSGGAPLVDADGRLLGLNAVRVDGGLILALSADGLRERVSAIAAGRRPAPPPRLGVAVVPPRVGRRMRRAVGLADHDGLLVRGVEAGTPAERAGVRRGDLIVSIAETPVSAIDDLYAALDRADEGSTVELGILRGVEELRLPVALAKAEVA